MSFRRERRQHMAALFDGRLSARVMVGAGDSVLIANSARTLHHDVMPRSRMGSRFEILPRAWSVSSRTLRVNGANAERLGRTCHCIETCFAPHENFSLRP